MAQLKKEEKIQVPKPDIRMAKVKIVGTSPLIFHKWDEKAMKMILDKQMKKAVGARETRNPEEEYEASFYKDSEGRIAFPANAVKQALVSAARNIPTITMALLRGSVFIVGDKDGLIPVEYKEKNMRKDMVRIGMGTADIRFRGEVTDWSMTLMIKYNAGVLSLEQVVNLLQTAGFACGLGEWRPERNGDFGTFEVK